MVLAAVIALLGAANDRRRARAGCAAALVLLVAAPAPGARAQDDASSPVPDALNAAAVSFPLRPVSVGVARRLDALVAAAQAAGINVKVAPVADRDDLGGLTDFFGRPEQYAAFLARQLPGFRDRGGSRAALLVVMPSGLG